MLTISPMTPESMTCLRAMLYGEYRMTCPTPKMRLDFSISFVMPTQCGIETAIGLLGISDIPGGQFNLLFAEYVVAERVKGFYCFQMVLIL